MKVIKAIGSGGPETLRILEVEMPVADQGQVLIAGELAAVNFADINSRRGTYQPNRSRNAEVDLGLEIYGRVAALGHGVTKFKIGQRVSGFSASGAYAEYVLADQDLVWAIPEGVSDEQAAAFPTVGQTAFHLLTSAGQICEGESVMATAAAGGVGSTAIQLAPLLGAERVVAVVGSSHGASLARTLGADVTIDTSQHGFQDIAAPLRKLIDVNLVVDGVGGELRQRVIECLTPFGRIVQFGNSSGAPEELPTLRKMRERCIGVMGFHMALMKAERKLALTESAARLLDWISTGALNIVIADILPFDQVAVAHQRLEDRQVRGKLLLSTPGS